MKLQSLLPGGVLVHPFGGFIMEKVLFGRHSILNRRPGWLRAVGMSLLFVLALSGKAFGQNIVGGRHRDFDREALRSPG